MSQFLYDVFVCHNSEDKGEVDTIVSYLEHQAGIRLWYDKYELRPGTQWKSFVTDEWPKILENEWTPVLCRGRASGTFVLE